MSQRLALKSVTCRACGADLIFDPATQATVCNYCGSSFRVENATDKIVTKPDGILPFCVTKEEYYQGLLEWLIDGDYTPDDVLDASIFGEVNGIYLPMFMYVGLYRAKWMASVGYDQEQEYADVGTDGKLVRRTKTVTSWQPCNGEISGKFTELIYAGESLNAEIATFVGNCKFEASELKEYDTRYTLGFLMQGFTADEEKLWETEISRRVEAIAKDHIRRRIPGDRYRDFSYDLFTKKKVLRIYAPFWIVHYKYKGEKYYFCMDGFTRSRVDGTRPEDKARKEEVAGFYGPLVLFVIIWIAIIMKTYESEAIRPIILGGAVMSIFLWFHASYKKEELLAKSIRTRRESLLDFKSRNKSLKKSEEELNSPPQPSPPLPPSLPR